MADTDGIKEAKMFYSDMPQKTEGFFLKGSNSLDWGMKNRLARIFNPVSGRTVMLAIDHGYFQGPTTGLERVDINILPLDALCGHPDADPGNSPQRCTAFYFSIHCAAGFRRRQHSQRAVQ